MQKVLQDGGGGIQQHRQNQSLTVIGGARSHHNDRIDEVSHSRNEWEETLGESQMIGASHSLK